VNSEQREIRPYPRAQLVQSTLESCRLGVGEYLLEPGDSLDVRAVDYATQHVELHLAVNEHELEALQEDLVRHVAALELDPDDVELVVITSTQRLKLAEIPWRTSLAHLHAEPTRIMLAAPHHRPDSFDAPFGGVRIDLYCLLSRQLSPLPLRPWRKGTWLADLRWELRSAVREVGFTPVPLDDELRRQLNLDSGTMRYVEFDGSALDPDIDESSLMLYVDGGLLTAITSNPNTPGSRFLQRQLFLDAVRSILMQPHLSGEIRSASYEEIQGSLLGRLIDMVAANGWTEQELFLEARDRPERFLALVEGRVAPGQDLLKTVGVNG
jgi:hypothetical protein